MEDHKWKMENELNRSSPIRSIFHFPFSICHLSLAVAIIATILSVSSFIYFFANGMTNVYGDGVAHVNIARKVVDSPDDGVWRRYIQIGSPWLPLQTVLMLPLVANEWMWRTGAAGSIVSMISFVIAALSLYLLARNFYCQEDAPWREALPALSAAIFILNPSVLYMQATPMAELVFMAALVSSVYLLQRWLDDQTWSRLVIAAVATTVGTLTRYEAWPVAVVSILIVALTSSGDWKRRTKNSALFSALAAIGPSYWLWHNWAIYGNAFEFLTGPNSARGIYLQNPSLGWARLFAGHAALDAMLMAAATAVCTGSFVLLLSAAGLTRTLIASRKSLLRISPLGLLILPFLFHVFSLYRGEIQVFPLSAFGLLNIRYGLPHLLGVALFAPAAVLAFKGRARRWVGIVVCLIVATQYWYLISEGPSQLAVYQEGNRNGVNARPVRERARVASFLMANPPDRLILMHTGALGPVVSQGGLRFSEIIHEGSLRWYQLDSGIPKDVATVMIQEGDPLDMRIRDNPELARDLANEFQERLSIGNIRVFERRYRER
jgi:Dolichyl-phosphate-mannose-protein mannosyltransferase